MLSSTKRFGMVAIAAVWAASSGCKTAPPGVYASDVIVTAFGKMRVTALVVPHEDDKNYKHPPVHKVIFSAGMAQVGEANLSEDAGVGAEINLPPGPTPQIVDMKTSCGRYTGKINIWVLDPAKPVAVITFPAIAHSGGNYHAGGTDRVDRGDAPKVLTDIAQQYQPIYYMGGPVTDIEEARKWLQKRGFPLGPVLSGTGRGFFGADYGLKERLDTMRNVIKADMIAVGAGVEEGTVLLNAGLSRVFLLPEDDTETDDYILNNYPRNATTERTWMKLQPKITGQAMPAPAPGGAASLLRR